MVIALVRIAFKLYIFFIVARCLASWFPIPALRPVYRFLYEMTEPVLKPFRQLIGYRMPIDLSPWLAIIVLQLIESMLTNMLRAMM